MRIVLAGVLVIVAVGLAVVLIPWHAGEPERPGSGEPAGGARVPDEAASGSWPMFRGSPSLRGIAAPPLADTLALAWRFETKGPVKSSAAIVAGRVYVGSDDGNVYALDLGTGKLLWKFATRDSVEASPLVLDGTVYVGSSDAFLYAIKDGEQVWKYETGDKILGAANWVAAADGARRILVGSYDNKVHCVAAADGSLVWTCETNNYVNGAPAVAGDVAVFGGCDAVVHVVSVADGKERAAIDSGAYIAASAAVAGDRAYVGNYESTFICVDMTGAGRIVWTYDVRDAAFLSAPAVDEANVVVGARDRRVHCLARAIGAVRWTFATGGEVDSSPVICGEKVVVGSSDGKLYLLRLADGKEIWSYEIGAEITASPAVCDGMVVVGAGDGWLYAFGAKRAP